MKRIVAGAEQKELMEEAETNKTDKLIEEKVDQLMDALNLVTGDDVNLRIAMEKIATSARDEERAKVNQIFNETKKNYDYFLPPSGQAMFWEDFGNRVVREFSNNQS